MHRKDLEYCLHTHGDKYVRGFESTKKSPDEIKDVKELEKNQEKQEKEIKHLEKEVTDLTTDLRT